MKANEINLNRFLVQSDTQFVIPVYQRNYDWTTIQCKKLLEDILLVGKDNDVDAHFIGSIVYIHDDVYAASGLRELTIIDGQQRLTTITILYLVLYQQAKKSGNLKLYDKINEQYLINKYDDGEGSKLKLRPTENNDKALRFLLLSEESDEFTDYSRVIENFNYFKGRITEENFATVLNGLSKLMFVEISLDRDKDEPQKIFESLNSTGLELSQADLIRNYILMGLKSKKQISIYRKYWEVIESMAKDDTTNQSRVSDFIRDYLTIKNKKISNKRRVYDDFKNAFSLKDYAQLESVLSEIKTYSYIYNKLINPQNEMDKQVRAQLKYINRLEINVSFPFLLQVFSDYVTSLISKEIFLEVLELVQTYVWRRFIIGLPTNALNKVFLRLYEDIDIENYVDSLARSLLSKKGPQRLPEDIEVHNNLAEKDLYNIKSKNRTYLFEKLENYSNQEIVKFDENPQITIEHIFPQNPDIIWKQKLPELEFAFIKANYLNTIANLTLSGNNGKLGNKYFTEKRDMNIEDGEQGYKFSRLWLNRDLASLDKWGKQEIESRLKLLQNRFFKVWRLPQVEFSIEDASTEVNIFDADDPTNKKIEYAIFSGEKIDTNNISDVYRYVVSQLFELQPQAFFTTILQEKLSINKNPTILRQPIPINDTYFIEANLSSRAKFERLKLALEIFDFEDELFVKYKD